MVDLETIFQTYVDRLFALACNQSKSREPEKFAALSPAQLAECRKPFEQRARETFLKLTEPERRGELWDSLRSGMLNPDNEQTRRLFHALTGIVLPKQVGATRTAVIDWFGVEAWAAHQKAHDEREALKQQEADRKAAEKEAAQLAKVRRTFAMGRNISAAEFEGLLVAHMIPIPARTLGMIRTKIESLTRERVAFVKGCRIGDTFWQLVRDLKAAIPEQEPERFVLSFGPGFPLAEEARTAFNELEEALTWARIYLKDQEPPNNRCEIIRQKYRPREDSPGQFVTRWVYTDHDPTAIVTRQADGLYDVKHYEFSEAAASPADFQTVSQS